MKKIMLAAMAVASLALAGCGQRVGYDEAAVEIKEIGANAGVQETEINTGRYWAPPLSYRYIVKFPTTLQTYKFDGAEANQPCFSFINRDKVRVTACLNMIAQIQPGKASDIVKKYKGAITKGGQDGYVLDDIIDGPVARELQNTLNYVGVKYDTNQLYSDGGQALLQEVQHALTPPFTKDGIMIQQLLWAKPPALPDDIVESIKGALRAQTDAAKSNAELAKTVAEGNKLRAQADADAYVVRARAEAITSNPKVLQQQWIEKWNGVLPDTVVGDGATTLLNLQK